MYEATGERRSDKGPTRRREDVLAIASSGICVAIVEVAVTFWWEGSERKMEARLAMTISLCDERCYR